MKHSKGPCLIKSGRTIRASFKTFIILAPAEPNLPIVRQAQARRRRERERDRERERERERREREREFY